MKQDRWHRPVQQPGRAAALLGRHAHRASPLDQSRVAPVVCIQRRRSRRSSPQYQDQLLVTIYEGTVMRYAMTGRAAELR